MIFQQLLNDMKQDVVFLIGNGVNKFNQIDNNSWNDLLLKLWNMYRNPKTRKIPEGLSLCEFYDIVELAYKRNGFHLNFKEEFCRNIFDWHPTPTHFGIVNWAIKNEVPILTANFDENLSKAGKCKLYTMGEKRMSYYYPWDRYFSNKKLLNINDGFGIWHVHGMERYSQSLRLGLTDYLGAVGRARKWIYEFRKSSDYFSANLENWPGKSSWLHLLLTKPLIIFGLGLERDEVFLRWLLIERWKLFLDFKKLEKPAWYISPTNEKDKGKSLFLKFVGINELKTETYEDVYSVPWIS